MQLSLAINLKIFSRFTWYEIFFLPFTLFVILQSITVVDVGILLIVEILLDNIYFVHGVINMPTYLLIFDGVFKVHISVTKGILYLSFVVINLQSVLILSLLLTIVIFPFMVFPQLHASSPLLAMQVFPPSDAMVVLVFSLVFFLPIWMPFLLLSM